MSNPTTPTAPKLFPPWYQVQLKHLIATATAVRRDAQDLAGRLKGLPGLDDEWIAAHLTALELSACEDRLKRFMSKIS